MLTDMQHEYEGFSRSVKAVMQQAEKGALNGVHGPVSALISTENRFVTAIDTALGASASSIVVDSTSDGKQCISYLKRTDGGRATFLPLDTIRANSLRESGLDGRTAASAPRMLSSDLMRHMRNRAQPAGAHGRCGEYGRGAGARKSYGHRFRIVTLDGQIIQPGGAMTGGSASRGTGALARAGRLRAAEEQAERCEVARKTAEQRFRAAEKRLARL